MEDKQTKEFTVALYTVKLVSINATSYEDAHKQAQRLGKEKGMKYGQVIKAKLNNIDTDDVKVNVSF